MHELALIESVMSMVKTSALENGMKKITRIGLVVGQFSNAVPESLSFAFEALKRNEDIFARALLQIKETPLICRCRQCACEFKPERDYRFVCPRCKVNDIEIISGRELYVDYYEGDETDG